MTKTKKVALYASLWIVPFAILLAALLLLASTLLPYQPYRVASYEVHPSTVCAGGEVSAYLKRKFTEQFAELKLEETWVTVRVPGIPADRPVKSNEGSLPRQVLHPTEGFSIVQSPLINQAPVMPGVYRIKVEVETHGTRWWVIPAAGHDVFYSDTIRVQDCEGAP